MSLEPNWSYLRNVFDNTTKGNFKRMSMMVRDHHDKLKSAAATDPDVAVLYAAFLPEYDAFNTALRKTHISDSKRQTLTIQLAEALTNLRKQVEDWDIRISFKHRPGTPTYNVLMGAGRTSFYLGTYEGQLAAVKELSDKLVDFLDLDDVKIDVDAWLDNADNLRTVQQGEEGTLQKAQKEAERARIALAKKMHFVFASLLAKYYEDPIEVENFYELKYLQRGSSKTTTTTSGSNGASNIKIPANSRKTMLKGSFSDTDAFEVKNTGNVVLNVWLSNNENSAMPNDVSTVNPGDSVTFYGDELSDSSAPLTALIIANNEGSEGIAEAVKVVL
jgi:hypothetical protein